MGNGMMKRIGWYVNRLKAMSAAEVAWRLQQKWLQYKEKERFGEYTNIAEALLYTPKGEYTPHEDEYRAKWLRYAGKMNRNARGKVAARVEDAVRRGGYRGESEDFTVWRKETVLRVSELAHATEETVEDLHVEDWHRAEWGKNADKNPAKAGKEEKGEAKKDTGEAKGDRGVAIAGKGDIGGAKKGKGSDKGKAPEVGERKEWPVEWAYDLKYKQRDELGDARLAWEKNRHLHWPRLALNFTRLKDKRYLYELDGQIDDWTKKNPMLYGIAWTSVMEVAIRAIQWTYTAQILIDALDSEMIKAEKPVAGEGVEIGEEDLRVCREVVRKLSTGAENMMWYVRDHRSRYSSANNHLLVELAAIVIVGCFIGDDEIVFEANRELKHQIPLQFSEGGVNKEVSLHYHTFAMEAYMLATEALLGCHRNVPLSWYAAMRKWARFAKGSMASDSTAIEFGDSDKGLLLNLTGPQFDYYRYLLQGATMLTWDKPEVYADFRIVEPTIKALNTEQQLKRLADIAPLPLNALEVYSAGEVKDKKGKKVTGFVTMRAQPRAGELHGATVMIDCAPMGFGSIAAHAHADMLSFQLYDNGEPLLTDGGTYLYHCGATDRDLRRSELMHNTIAVSGHPQGEMRGAFLWGKRGAAWINDARMEGVVAVAECSARMADGWRIGRTFRFDTATGMLAITDSGLQEADVTSFIVSAGVEVDVAPDGRSARIGRWTLTADSGKLSVEDVEIAPEYGELVRTKALRLKGRKGSGKVEIKRG